MLLQFTLSQGKPKIAVSFVPRLTNAIETWEGKEDCISQKEDKEG